MSAFLSGTSATYEPVRPEPAVVLSMEHAVAASASVSHSQRTCIFKKETFLFGVTGNRASGYESAATRGFSEPPRMC